MTSTNENVAKERTGPVLLARGVIEWRINDLLHREDGPAVERANGDKEWWINGKLHRVDGPAVELGEGSMCWYINGKLHREDGPALEYTNDDKEWFINDTWITDEVNKWREEMGITNDELTPEETVLFKLYFGNRK